MQAVRGHAPAEAVLAIRSYGTGFVPWVVAVGEEGLILLRRFK